MARWIVVGCDGQLGRCLVNRLESLEPGAVRAIGRKQLDLADSGAVDRSMDEIIAAQTEVLFNAAAYTAVDSCESEEELALRINGDAPALMARRCAEGGIRMVHVSTDYVFDGSASEPYATDAQTSPQSAYGRTKLAGESAVLAASSDCLVVRTSWVFGPGKNFVGAILRQGALRRSGDATGPLQVVADQRGCPTYAADLAEGLVALAQKQASGLFHLSNAGEITWWDFARAILEDTGYGDLEIEAIETLSLSLPAPRPAYSVLDCGRAASLGVTLRPWREALAAHLATLSPANGVAA